MLVLLIMLIITIPIQLHAVNLNMPTGTPPASVKKPEVLRIDIDASSQVLWNGEAVTDPEELERRMQDTAHRAEQPEVHLRPDRHAKLRRGGRRAGCGQAPGPGAHRHHRRRAVRAMSTASLPTGGLRPQSQRRQFQPGGRSGMATAVSIAALAAEAASQCQPPAPAIAVVVGLHLVLGWALTTEPRVQAASDGDQEASSRMCPVA